jgi:hypothetical protein
VIPQRWTFDHAEVNRIAREAFGVTHPVKLRRRTRRYDRRTGLYSVKRDQGGRCGWDPGTREHEVLLVNVPCVESMLRTLAHELEHAAQRDRMGARHFTGLERKRRGRFWNLYRADPEGWERLARAAEERWRELMPAVKVRA